MSPNHMLSPPVPATLVLTAPEFPLALFIFKAAGRHFHVAVRRIVADVVALLASDAAHWITTASRSVIPTDGTSCFEIPFRHGGPQQRALEPAVPDRTIIRGWHPQRVPRHDRGSR